MMAPQIGTGPLADGVPPREIRLFFAGPNETTKGSFLFTERSAQVVIENWQSRGIKLLGDYEHMSLVDDPPIIAPASCEFDLEVRNGELWAVNIAWTKRAYEYIKNKEYCYWSAAFFVDPETDEVTQLRNFALTNLPAANHLTPLAAKQIAAKAYDPEGWALAEDRFNTEKRTPNPAPTIKAREAKTPATKLKETKMPKFSEKLGDKMSGDDAVASAAKACDMDSESMSAMMDAAPGAMSPEQIAKLPALAKHLSMPVEHLCAYSLGFDPDDDGDGDVDDDNDGDGDEEMKALKSAVIACTGKSDLVEARAVLQAMSSTAASASELQAQVVSLSDEIKALKGGDFGKEFERILSDAKRDGKIAPAEIESGPVAVFLNEQRKDEKNGLKSLRAFVSALTPKVITASSKTKMEPVMTGLTAEEEQIAAKMGIAPEQIAETKRKLKGVKLTAE